MKQILIFTGRSPLGLSSRLRFTNSIPLVNSIENTSEQYLHRGEEGVDNFCLKLNEIRAEIEEMMKYNEAIDMSAEDERHLKNATHCCICGDKFKSTLKKNHELNNRKVRDRCHFTGRYRGSSCTRPVCNLNWCNKYFEIPVIFHNVKNYDVHFIIQNSNRFRRSKEINVRAQNSEKFFTFG